jgi:hypothetical protein
VRLNVLTSNFAGLCTEKAENSEISEISEGTPGKIELMKEDHSALDQFKKYFSAEEYKFLKKNKFFEVTGSALDVASNVRLCRLADADGYSL